MVCTTCRGYHLAECVDCGHRYAVETLPLDMDCCTECGSPLALITCPNHEPEGEQ